MPLCPTDMIQVVCFTVTCCDYRRIFQTNFWNFRKTYLDPCRPAQQVKQWVPPSDDVSTHCNDGHCFWRIGLGRGGRRTLKTCSPSERFPQFISIFEPLIRATPWQNPLKINLYRRFFFSSIFSLVRKQGWTFEKGEHPEPIRSCSSKFVMTIPLFFQKESTLATKDSDHPHFFEVFQKGLRPFQTDKRHLKQQTFLAIFSLYSLFDSAFLSSPGFSVHILLIIIFFRYFAKICELA